jgi:hypothetical protein
MPYQASSHILGIRVKMKNNERIIQYFDLGLSGKTLARDIPHSMSSPRTLDELMNELMQLRELNKARKKVTAGSKLEFRLEDMEELEDCWVLLINVVDTDAAHPVTQLVGGDDEDREVTELSDERGLESSSHLIILKSQTDANKHLALFEKSTSLPFSKAGSFLNHLFKVSARHNVNEYKKPHPSGEEGRTINVFCNVNFLAHPSDEFRQELDSGQINGIKITSDMNVIRGYDSNTHSELIGADIKMKVGRLDVLLNGGNWGHLQKAIQHANTLDSPFVRVSFTDESGSGHTATLSTDTGTLWQADKYVKKCKIEGFGNALRTSFPNIHDGIKNKMIELI